MGDVIVDDSSVSEILEVGSVPGTTPPIMVVEMISF